MQLPVDGTEECHLVRINLTDLKARDSAPRACAIVAVLQILRCQDERRKKHSATALQSAACRCILGLLHREVEAGHMCLDQDEVVECNLER